MPEFPLEREADKPEVQLQITVYFHADVVEAETADGINIYAGELGERTQAIRHAIENALQQEDETLAEWAYREVRLGQRVITRHGIGPITIQP